MADEDDALGGDVADVGRDLDFLNGTGGSDDERGGTGETHEEDETEEEGETPPDGEESEGGDGGEEDSPDEDVEEEGEKEEEGEEEEDGDEKDKEDEEEEDDEVEEPGQHRSSEANRLVKRVDKEFKGVFKKFPELRRAVFRDHAYNELFSTVDDAREASEKAETMDQHEARIMAGDPSILLKTLGETDVRSLESFSLNFLPTLGKLAPTLVAKACFPYIRGLLASALADADSAGNKNLKNSIGHISQYLWKSFELPPEPKAAEVRRDPAFVEAQRRAHVLEQRLDDDFRGRTARVAHGRLNSMILEGLTKDEKLKDKFSPYELRHVAADIFRQVTSALDADQRYSRGIDAIFDRAARDGYKDDYMARVRDAFLAGARTHLSTARAKVVADALKEKGMKVGDKDKNKGKVKKVIEHPRTPPSSRNGLGKGGKVDRTRSVDYNSSSDEDILAGNVRYRK